MSSGAARRTAVAPSERPWALGRCCSEFDDVYAIKWKRLPTYRVKIAKKHVGVGTVHAKPKAHGPDSLLRSHLSNATSRIGVDEEKPCSEREDVHDSAMSCAPIWSGSCCVCFLPLRRTVSSQNMVYLSLSDTCLGS